MSTDWIFVAPKDGEYVISACVVSALFYCPTCQKDKPHELTADGWQCTACKSVNYPGQIWPT